MFSRSHQNITQESPKAIFKQFWVIFFIVIGFIALSVFSFCLAQLVHKGFSDKGFEAVGKFLRKLESHPTYLAASYSQWWHSFLNAWQQGRLTFASFVPMFTPLVFSFMIICFFVKSSISFRLWYKINNHFAEATDVKNMGLFDGHLLALGLFGDKILKLKHCASVLCFGETGCGKTAGIAIPSILESDSACVVAVDNRNELAKYTSGYRSTLGKVFYFNWNLRDEPLKNEFYPRWNPLSIKDMPAKGIGREEYLSGLAHYFISGNSSDQNDGDNYWEKLAVTAFDGILNFFISKLERAGANDYFLSEMLDKGRLSKDDKDLLLSYYVLMDKEYAQPGIQNIEKNRLNMDSYLPIGSWEGIPKAWQGKEINLAMFSDWLMQSYFMVKSVAEKSETDAWKIVIERFIEEAKFFGYNEKSLEVLQQLFYLSQKQRDIIFPMVINSLAVFRHSSVRERTSTSDFHLSQARGIKNPVTEKWEVVTIYSVTGNKSVDFIGKLFIDMLIETNISSHKKQEPFPLVFVMDDVDQQPKYESLVKGISHASHSRMTFLLLSDYVKMMEEKYTAEGMEEIVSHAAYKLMLADSYKTLAWKFENLALFGTKSVQIPAVGTGNFLKNKSGLTDAGYYKMIAQNLNSIRKNDLEIGDEFLISAGYYHLPVKLKSIYFLKNEPLKKKATLDANYFLDDKLEKKRNVQDVDTPTLSVVLQDSGMALRTEEDIKIYIEDRYEEALETRQVVADKQSALADDISSRWQSRDMSQKQSEEHDWWLDEDSFSFDADSEGSVNPFKTK